MATKQLTAGRKGRRKKAPENGADELLLDDDEFFATDQDEEIPDIERSIPRRNARRIAARRAIEARLEDLTLRQALEDYPESRAWN